MDPETTDDTDYLVATAAEDDDPESLTGDEADLDPAAVPDEEG
ncbi:hypothetical protein AB0K20_09575 [Micromonospora matsumotoense]